MTHPAFGNNLVTGNSTSLVMAACRRTTVRLHVSISLLPAREATTPFPTNSKAPHDGGALDFQSAAGGGRLVRPRGPNRSRLLVGGPRTMEASLRGLPAIRCDSPRPTSQLREYRQRSRFYRGDHRRSGRPCRRFGIRTLDAALIMAADTISGYIQGLLNGIEFKQTAYALDRDSRKAALARFLKRASEAAEEESRLAA